jgi:endoglycosylceramidase
MRSTLRGLTLVATVAVLLGAPPAPAARAKPATQPVPPLAAAGRWLVDATGRVVLLHGVNDVEKSAPYYPAAAGLGEDDAAFLAAEGFSVLRLGVDFRGLMPVPGMVDAAYVEHLAETVDVFGRHGLFVLLDFHQDGFSPMFNGNGLPDWMAITDGLPNPPDAVFPFYYIQNPAMQRAFEHFWANDPGPGGVGLQDYFVQGLVAVVSRFADDAMVLGYELLNEPWPGATWMPCLAAGVGCPDLEASLLHPFGAKAAAAVRAITSQQLVFVEPFVLFNFGQAPTMLPGAGSDTALAFHSYAVDVAGEEAVVRYAVEAAERDGAPVLETEFGATNDPATLTRLTAQADARLVPWIFWAYNENVVADRDAPAGPDNLRSRAAFEALVRPYPLAVAGTPTTLAFDADTKALDVGWIPQRPDGTRAGKRLQTTVWLPKRQYPQGYTAEVTGAVVTSKPCVEALTLRARPHVRRVTVHVTPGGRGARRCG